MVAARIRRINGNQPALLAMFDSASGFSDVALELVNVRAGLTAPSEDLASVTARLELARDAGLDPSTIRRCCRTSGS